MSQCCRNLHTCPLMREDALVLVIVWVRLMPGAQQLLIGKQIACELPHFTLWLKSSLHITYGVLGTSLGIRCLDEPWSQNPLPCQLSAMLTCLLYFKPMIVKKPTSYCLFLCHFTWSTCWLIFTYPNFFFSSLLICRPANSMHWPLNVEQQTEMCCTQNPMWAVSFSKMLSFCLDRSV